MNEGREMLPETIDCRALHDNLLEQHSLIIVSNRGPVSIEADAHGERIFRRGGGGLVTALMGLARHVPSTWIAGAAGEDDREWSEGDIPLDEEKHSLHVRFVSTEPEEYEKYYQKISNPLLWFLQHSIWDFSTAPTINRETWDAWENGYVKVNQQFADMVVEQIRSSRRQPLVMLHDYHLYLAPRMIRRRLGRQRRAVLTHFVHIPWPGPEDWGMLPHRMREGILNGLCALDMVGFQTREDAMNFIRTCESLLPNARVNYRRSQVILDNHTTHVRDFPISIDVDSILAQSCGEEVSQYAEQLEEMLGERKIILRIDRTEPSKNIVRGFQAFEELLEYYPEHRGEVQFLALLVPSRLEVDEYQGYLEKVMAAAGIVNARYGTSNWEPVRVLVGESYPRAIAAMQLYDVLLVNPVADGMNLVAKEGPTVNRKDGVMILSERAGAHQQLGAYTLIVSPCDVSATAEALHQALTMDPQDRHERACTLRSLIEKEDIHRWLCWQLDEIRKLMHWEEREKARVPSG